MRSNRSKAVAIGVTIAIAMGASGCARIFGTNWACDHHGLTPGTPEYTQCDIATTALLLFGLGAGIAAAHSGSSHYDYAT